jgi:4-hydroxybenzoate polyprenyltransferase
MSSFNARFHELKHAFTLIYLSAMGFLSVYSVERYLGAAFDPYGCLSFMGIIFGVYTLNRFTDTTEDFTNDIGKLLFFQRKKTFLFLACGALAVSMGVLLASRKWNWMHFLLLAMGFAYSYRILPWYSPATGFRMLRIKEMTLLKNLSVSFLWGASVFVVPILNSGAEYHESTIGMLALGLFISTLNNTLFDDILDEAGDRVAGIKTLPAAWGGRNSQILLMAIDVAWLGLVAAFRYAGAIDSAHAAFLAFLGMYPFLYMGLHMGGKASKGLVGLLSETDLLFFALGMLLLGLAR